MRSLADLVWVMQSPSLLESPETVQDSWCEAALHAQESQAALEKLRLEPLRLEDYITRHSRSHRLGVYFETLVSFWLSELLKFRDMRKNVPVRSAVDGRTVGEFDFLFRDPTQSALTHWETAVKFYLYLPEDQRFHGPAGKDRLDLKLSRLFDHQLRLSNAAGLGEPVLARAFVKGRLFYPLENDWRLAETAKGLSPRHLRGWWTRSVDSAILAHSPQTRWAVLSRYEWLSPVLTSAPLDQEEFAARVRLQFELHLEPVMVAALERHGDNLWVESSRGVIVYPSWPPRLIS